MRKSSSLIIRIVSCLTIALVAYLWATNLMGSMYSYRSPLSSDPPSPGAALGNSITSKVVIILIDALRLDTASDPESMPFLNSLRINSARTTMHSQPPSYSEGSWTTLLTGAWPDISDGPAINLEYKDITPFTQDDLFSASQRSGIKTAISGYYWFEKMVPQKSVNYFFYTEGEDAIADQQVVEAALPWLKDPDIGLILIHLDQVDYAGHYEGGPISPNWRIAALRVDNIITQIIGQVDLAKDTILIISDHGQIDAGGHGGTETIVLTQPFILLGNGIKPGQYPDVQSVDVAPTLAVLLGTNIPATNQGDPLLNMLVISDENAAVVDDLLAQQQSKLINKYSNALGAGNTQMGDRATVIEAQALLLKLHDNRLMRERAIRAMIAMIVLGFFIYFFSKLKPRKPLLLLIGIGLLYSLLFNIRYLLIDKHPYSLSWVTGQIDLIQYCAITTGIAFTFCWLIYFLLSKLYFQNPYDTALQIFSVTLTTLFIVSMPIFISFIVNGILISWTLPDVSTMFTCFLALIQSMLISIIGIILAGLSALLSAVLKNRLGVQNEGKA
jgi:hypothetical protein